MAEMLNADRQGDLAERGVKWYAWLTALVIVGYPVVSYIPAFSSIPNQAITIPFRAIVAGIALIVLLANIRERRVYSGVAAVMFLFFWCIYFIRIAFDTTFLPVPLSRPASEFIIKGFGICFLPACAAFAVIPRDEMEVALKLTIRLAAVTVFLSIVWFGQVLLAGGGAEAAAGFARLYTHYLNPISMGHVGATLAILLLYQAASRRRPPWGRGAQITGIGAGLLIVGASASKAPIVAIVLASPALLWIAIRHGIGKRAVVVAFLLAGVTAWGAMVLQSRVGFGVIARVDSVLTAGGDQTSQERVYMLRNAWNEFLDHPLTGYELEEPLFGQYPHNIVVEAFMATGIVGGTLVTLLVLGGTVSAGILIFRSVPEAWIGLLYIQYMSAAFLSGALYESDSAWWTLAAVLSFAVRHRQTSLSRRSELRMTRPVTA